jgi:hypothetical protein
MTVPLRTLDDAAWVSVNDERTVSVSELWRFPDPTFCACDLPDFVVEGFVEVGVDGRTVEVRAYGQCIQCGESNTTGWLPVGRTIDGEFYHIERESVVRPAGVRPAEAVDGTLAGGA